MRCTRRAKWVIATTESHDYACDGHLAQIAIGPHVLSHRPAGPGERGLQCSAVDWTDEQIHKLLEDCGLATTTGKKAEAAAEV